MTENNNNDSSVALVTGAGSRIGREIVSLIKMPK